MNSKFRWRRPCVLSVVTPTYNRADYLKETIDSVLAQDFPDVQYIVMDDGSTDDTKSLVRRYGRRVEYYRHDNVGEQKTVNRGLALVRGEFFMIVNSDDPVLPGCLARMVGALRGNAGALAAYPDWQVTDPQSKPLTEIRVGPFDTVKMLTTTSISIGPGACFRSSVLELVGYRNPLLRYSADLDYWHRIALAGKILYVPELLATHRTHPTSASVAERGNLLARESAYLYEAYSRHPRLPRRMARVADARAHFVSAFVCTDLREAARGLLRSFLINPIGFLECLDAHGCEQTIEFLNTLGGDAQGARVDTATLLATVKSADCRMAAYRHVVRVGLRDPVGLMQAIMAFGVPQLAAEIRRLPLYSG